MKLFLNLVTIAALASFGATRALSASAHPQPAPGLDSPTMLLASDGYCKVVNIRQGQLALRTSPNGTARAGLVNKTVVQILRTQGIWSYVRVSIVYDGNAQLLGLEGWVNMNYLDCGDDVEQPDL